MNTQQHPGPLMKRNFPKWLISLLMMTLLAPLLAPLPSPAADFNLEKSLVGHIEKSIHLIKAIQGGLESDADTALAFTRLKTLATNLHDENLQLEALFSEREKKLTGLPQSALERHTEMAQQFSGAIEAYLRRIDQIRGAAEATPAVLEELASLLETLTPDKKPPIHARLDALHLPRISRPIARRSPRNCSSVHARGR